MGVISPGVAGIGTSCFVVILLSPLIACPMLSLLRLRLENDFFLVIDLLASGSSMSSSAGGVGTDGRAVMLALIGIVADRCDVDGLVIEMRLLLLDDAAGFRITPARSTVDMLAVEGLLM